MFTILSQPWTANQYIFYINDDKPVPGKTCSWKTTMHWPDLMAYRYSWFPLMVVRQDFQFLPLQIWIRLKQWIKTMNLALLTCSGIRGRWYQNLTAASFKAVQGQKPQSFFYTEKKLKAVGDVEGLATHFLVSLWCICVGHSLQDETGGKSYSVGGVP